jgi:hypothetical protein
VLLTAFTVLLTAFTAEMWRVSMAMVLASASRVSRLG